MNVTTQTEEYPALTSLVISPNLQALLEFDDRLRESSKGHKRPVRVPSSNRTQHGRHPSWGEQEVPTVSLPPPRRRKKSSLPASPKTISELEDVSPSTKTLPEAGEFGGSEEVLFTMPEDIQEEREMRDLRNPYLNSPPSPRYFNRLSNDGDDQLSAFCTLGRSWSVGPHTTKRQRSLSDQSQRNQLLSSRSSGRSVGPRPRERGTFPVSCSQLDLIFVLANYQGHVQRRQDRCFCTATRLLSLPPTLIKYVLPGFRPYAVGKDG